MEFGLLCRMTLHISHVGHAKTIFSPLHAHVCSASLCITCFIYNMSKLNSVTFQSEYHLKELFFSSTVQSNLLFVSLPVTSASDFLADLNTVIDGRKNMLFPHLHMVWAVEQVNWQGPMLCNESQQGQNREAEPPLSDPPWDTVWDGVLLIYQLPTQLMDGFCTLLQDRELSDFTKVLLLLSSSFESW